MSVGTNAGQWVRRRCYSKVHVKSWTIFLEKDGYVKCSFQNCKFMAFDVEEMAKHYSLCGGNGSPDAKYVCPSCEGCTVSYAKLQLHMTKAHNMNIDTPEQIVLDKNLQSDETINFTEKEKLPLSKVIILSWRCSFEKNKFIKCSDCGILATDVDDLVRHYPDCKKVSIYACYVCDHCMGRAVDIHFLACHMFVAHDININYANYNVISHQMVRFWEDEIKRKKFSYCLHKTDGENDCLFFEMDIISLIFHVQHCKGIKPDDRHVCFYCGCWTMTLEKLKHHIEVSHSDPLGTLIFASETARKQTSSNKPEPEYIIPEYNSEQNPVIKKERNFEGNIISNTGYNLFDELTDAEGSVYCEENENEISQQEDCHEVQLYEGHKAYSSRKSKALFNNSNSLCVAPEINHNYTDERGTSVENINCVEDQVLGLQAINQKHLLPSQQSTEVNIESKKSSLQHLVINEDVYSNNETFGGASQNLGKGEQKEVELIIPENHLGLSNLSKCNSVVLSKLSVVHKDGSFQVIPQSTENETSKLQVHSVLKNKSNGNDIFHLKDGCIVEVTICEREIRSPSNIVNEKDNEEIELNKLRNENIQLELNIVPESIKLSVETNKKHAGTQIDCFDGCNESIEFARNLACVTEISAPINNDNDIKSDKNLFVEKSSYASAKSSSDGITRNQGEKNHNLLETHYQQNNEKTQITLTVMEKATELQNISVHESNKSNLKLPNNSIEDMTKTNLCDPIPNQEKINAGDPNTIKLSKVNITQDLPMEQLKPYPTCNSLVFGQSNFCENSYEIPNEGDQSLELTEPIDCPETNIKDVNLLMITSNQAFTVNKLTNENGSLENDPYETKPSQERHQEDKNNISSINILNSLVSENRIMIEPFLPNNISHGIKENVNIALQGDEPTEQELFSEGSSVYMTNVLIMKSNSITVENDSQNEINISKAEGKPTAEPKGVPSQQACHNIKTLIVSGNKAIMKTDEIHKNEEKKTNEMPKELISEGNHIECILKTEVNTREKVPKVSGKINVDEVPLLNGSVDLRDKETTKYLATESKSLIQSQETKSITVVCEINPILYETKKQYPSVTNNLSIIKVQEEEEKHTNEKKEQSVFKELLFQEREKLIDIITPETGQISQILYERQKDNDANETATEKQISDEVNHDNMELVTTSGSQTTVLQKIVGNEAKGADQQLTSESSVNNRKISNKKGKNHQLLTQDLERQNTTSVIEDPVVTHNKPIVQIYKKHRNGGETLQAKTEKVEPENKSKGMMKNIISRFQINEEKDKSGERKCLTKQIICEESKPINKDLISTRFKPPEVKMLEGNVLLSEGCVKDQSKLCINSLQNIEENLTPESTVNILSSGDIDFRLENSLDVLENQNEQINENNKLNIQVVSNCVAETKSISKSITVCKRKRGRPRKEIKKTDSQYPVEFVNDSNSFEIDNSFLSSNKDVTKCSNVEQTISLKNKDKITENSQISDVMSKEKSFEAINSTLSSNTDINVLEVPIVEQSASLSEVTNIDHSETSDSDFQSDTSKIVYPSSPTKKKNSSPRKKIAPTINSKNQKSSDFEIKNNSFVVNSVILSKVDVNVAETSNFEQSLSVSEKQITKQSKTYNDDLEVVAFQTESSLNTRKKRGRPPKKKLKEGSIESLKPKDFESNKKSFVAGNSVSFSNVDVNVAEVLSLTEENMIEHSQTPNSELKTETETEPNGDSIETEKPNDFVSNISLIEKDNSVLFSNRDVNVSKASNTHQTSCLSDIQIIEDHNTSDCDLQSKTSTMKCPSNTKKKRGRPPRKEKLVDSVPDDISSKCSSINNFIPLARSSRTTRKQTSSLNQIDGSNTICNKWYIHPDDSTNQVTIVPRPKRGRPGKTDENSFVHFMVSGEDTPALVTTGIEVAVDTTQKPKKIDMRFKCNRLPRIGDAVGPRIQLKDSIMVKCGRCGQEMSKLKYQTSHEIKHNYLCWLEGEEPIDINDESVVLRILTSRRKNKKIAFKCEECGMAKRSAVGFQSHIQFCGKSPEEREAMMQRCEVCGRIMMPASLKVHMGLAHNPKKPLPVEKPEPLTFVKGRRAAASKAELTFQDGNNGEEDDDSDIPTKRRRRSSSPIDDSVKRLYSKPFMRLSNGQIAIWKKHISEKGFGECYSPGCIFVGESIKVLQDHIKDCEYTPKKMYSCRQCQYSTQFEHEVIEHIKEEHEAFLNQEYSCSNSSDSESDSCQTPTTSSKRNYPKLKFIRKLARQQRHRYLHQALTWTYDSHLKMSSTSNLFVELQYKPCDWVPMSHDTAESYLPSTKTSIQLMVNDQDWKQLELFEGIILDGTPAMFVGGPVWACAWAPLPNTETQQYMAVACHPDMDAEHAMGCTYSYKSIIQIWDFGSLCNITAVIVAPYLMLGIAHNHGAVWALEWCESGCFNSFQLGLLAAACSDGSIVIYSIPRHQPSKSNVIYEVNPVAVLKLGCEMLTQCMRIAWHKVTPHNVLAGGFANGMVALWDLTTSSTLLRFAETIFPYCVFQAHNSSITGISFSPGEGARYISTSSADRANKFWDLQDTTAPISVNRKGTVTDSTWLPHWLCSVSIYDDVYGYGSTNMSLFAYRDFFFQPYPLVPQLAVNWSLMQCDWLNSVGTCDETGRVYVSFPLQLIHMDDKKGRKSTQNVILTSIQDFGEVEEVNIPLNNVKPTPKKAKQKGNNKKEGASFLEKSFETNLKQYKEMSSRFGLSLSIDKTMHGLNLVKKEINPANFINSYPLASVNKVSWNPNYKSFLWIAAGFQCGLVVAPCVTYIRQQDLITFYKRNETR